MFRQFIIFFLCVFYNTIHTIDLGNNFRGYRNQLWPRVAQSSFPIQAGYDGRVAVNVYYEALCPACQTFFSNELLQIVKELGPLLNIFLCPYGNAKTIPTAYGGYDFISQHGPEETYGNKLQACAIDVLQNMTAAIQFNACLLDNSQGKSSDDSTVDMCGALLNVDANAIKLCAKGSRGSILLKYYGDESMKVGFKSVPTILVNGLPSSPQSFRKDVYRALTGRMI